MTHQSRARLAEPQSVSPPQVDTGPSPRRSAAEPGAHANPAPAPAARKHCPVCHERYPADFRVCPRDATALEVVRADSDPLIGVVLADTYDILRVIGEGATGRVYEARHTRLRAKRYAIKVMYGDLTRQPAVVERFLREAEATSALSHPNVICALDLGQTQDGRPYIVSELLRGVQLGEYFARRGQLPAAEAVRIVRQACQALIAAHDKGIVHRDIKPANLFLLGEPGSFTVKVLDFGISLVGDASLTKTGMVMGTPAYMPPEQASGTRVDHRADIYALSAVLYEALTGTRAFAGADPIATLASVLTREPTRPRTLNPAIPADLELVIQKAMSKLPSQRYRSMRELDAALAPYDTEASGAASTPPIAAGGPPKSEQSVDIRMAMDLDTDMVSLEDLQRDQALQDEALRPDGELDVLSDAANLMRRSRVRLPGPLVRLVGSESLDSARVQLIWFAWVMGVTMLLGLIDATTSAIRVSRQGAPLSGTEFVLSTLGALGLMIMPTLLFGHYVSVRVWPSTPRVLETARRMRRVLFAGLATYAAGTLLLRVFASVLSNDSGGVAPAGWGLLMFAVAALVGLRTALREVQRAGLQES